MMLSEHKGALALAGCLFTRPGLPGHHTAKKGTGTAAGTCRGREAVLKSA